MSHWQDTKSLKETLVADGWRSPDIYAGFFDVAGPDAAVYLFLLLDRADYRTGMVAYVGMSINLIQRWSGHEILRELNQADQWVMRWFKPTPAEQLRCLESELIQAHNPPWNIIGRRRGVPL
jgi:hypothetical protein